MFATVAIKIRLLDVNDNAPVFTEGKYQLAIPEDRKPRESVSLLPNFKEFLLILDFVKPSAQLQACLTENNQLH